MRAMAEAYHREELAVGEGIEPSTFRLTAGRCTNSTTPQQGLLRIR
jgi:hypothetical protein